MIRAQEGPLVLILDVDGPATMMESPAVDAAVAEQLARGVSSIRVHLNDCTVMDSTFSGTLLSLQRQLDKIGGRLTLVSPSKRVLELLGEMGLEDFYAIDVAEPPDGNWTLLVSARPRSDVLRKHVLDAHDELARTPGPASRGFGRVAEELRRPDDGNGNKPPSAPRPHLV